jgi:hypothetical protein
MSPVSSHHGRLSPLCSNSKNNNDSDNDRRVLSYKGRKIFTSNSSFANLKNEENLTSPNSFRDCSNKGSELFKNIEELKKKKEEIYIRKIKRETSEERREQLRREKDKDIKIAKINIDIKNKNIIDNSKNKMRIIPISKKGINTIMKNKNKNNIRINSNDIKNKSIKLSHFNRNKVRDSIDYNKNIIYNFNKNKDSGRKINSFSNISEIIGEEANNLYSKESEEENNNLFSSQKNPKKNIIKIKKNTENSKPKKHANFKIKENIEFLRESQDSKHK